MQRAQAFFARDPDGYLHQPWWLAACRERWSPNVAGEAWLIRSRGTSKPATCPHTIVPAFAFLDSRVHPLARSAARSGRPVILGGGDLPQNFVSALVIEVVTDPTARGRTLQILGPQKLTMTEVALERQAAAEREPIGERDKPRHSATGTSSNSTPISVEVSESCGCPWIGLPGSGHCFESEPDLAWIAAENAKKAHRARDIRHAVAPA